MDKLRECPFCGNDDMDDDEGCYPMGKAWVVRCGDPSCHAELVGDTRKDVIAHWNRRADDLIEITEAGKAVLK